jgi:hypothetical protein
MFFTFKNGIILFLQLYRLTAIVSEAKNGQADAMAHNKADALVSLNSASALLDKYVLLSFKQSVLSSKAGNNSATALAAKRKSLLPLPRNNSGVIKTVEEAEKRLSFLSPILVRSSLTRFHTYVVVLTSTSNVNVSCCQCECHVKNGSINNQL